MSALQAGLLQLRKLQQLLQFALVGAAAAAAHLAVVALLVAWARMAPLAANGLAFMLAFTVSYHGHVLLTFHRAQARGWAVAARFFAVACLSFAVNEALYALALHWLHWHYLWSQAGVLVIVAATSFVLGKFWAFKVRAAA